MLVVLGPEPEFPPAEQALDDPNGLLAVGGDLSLERLRAAYRHGIFPWYSPGQPLLWWSPDPRMVLVPDSFHASANLRKRLRRLQTGRDSFEVRVDTACADVMAACATPRAGQPGTWITPDMQAAYLAWHRSGEVHSIETWQDGHLVGGLYGVSQGGAFFGESMFSRIPDASKVALACLVAFLDRHGVELIDCQQETSHLASLGARPMTRAVFLDRLARALELPTPPWRPGRLLPSGELLPAAMMTNHEPV
ncbi:MAG: leucyl/phenylalanyl-tRNA--protein transferase [Pigmentiphaga sp.]|nr:leucyl/phenylalanyl-tRNA--protein transferase [Pigmentiphaga sp.]